jgi:hypothetical protein
MNKKNPTHNCTVLGPNVMLPRAFNTAEPNKMYYKCPFCGCEKPVIDWEEREKKINDRIGDTVRIIGKDKRIAIRKQIDLLLARHSNRVIKGIGTTGRRKCVKNIILLIADVLEETKKSKKA